MAEQRARFDETLEVLIRGLSSDELEFEGAFYRYDQVPMALRPVQRPHPPLWYGAGSPDSIRWCARNGVNMVTLALGERVRQATELYRAQELTSLEVEAAESSLAEAQRAVTISELDRAVAELRSWAAAGLLKKTISPEGVR